MLQALSATSTKLAAPGLLQAVYSPDEGGIDRLHTLHGIRTHTPRVEDALSTLEAQPCNRTHTLT
jgi:hypothetical protein